MITERDLVEMLTGRGVEARTGEGPLVGWLIIDVGDTTIRVPFDQIVAEDRWPG